MAKVLDQMVQPRNAAVPLESLSGGHVARVRHPSEKLQAMQGKRNCQLCCSTADHSAEDCEQENEAHQEEALIKAKRREDRTHRHDQAAKAAQLDSLKVQPTQAQGMADVAPTVVDNVVSLSYYYYSLHGATLFVT